MSDFFKWLSGNPTATTTLIVSFCFVVMSVTLMYLIAFFQGREISLWPPKIGAKPEQGKQKEGFLTVDPRPLLGAQRATVQFPYAPSKTVNAFLDEIYYSQEPLIEPWTYNIGWVLRDTESGKTFTDMGKHWAEMQGLPIDIRPIKAVDIKSGMKLEIITPEGHSNKKGKK